MDRIQIETGTQPMNPSTFLPEKRDRIPEYLPNAVIGQHNNALIYMSPIMGMLMCNASLILRSSFGYASIIPGWEKQAKNRWLIESPNNLT